MLKNLSHLVLVVLAMMMMSTSSIVSDVNAQAPASDELHRLFDDRFERLMSEFPQWAMSRGDYRFADRLSSMSFEAIERRLNATKSELQRLRAIDPTRLNEQDRVSYELFELELVNEIEGHRFRDYLMPIGPRSGPQQDIPQLAEHVRFDREADYTNYLARLREVPRVIDETIALMQRGVAEGRTPPQVTLAGMPEQFSAVLSGGLDRLAEPFDRPSRVLTEAERRAMKETFDEEIRPAIHASIETLRDYLIEEYLPVCRTSIAAADLPDGEAYYNHQLRVMTTLDLTAREIHDIGLSEVARLRREMMEVIRSSDFMEREEATAAVKQGEQALFEAFVHYLRTDPRFYYDNAEDLLAGYRDICKRMDGALPKLFNTLPRLPYGVKEIPRFMAPTQTTAYYMPGDIDNAEPGWFYANTYALDQRPTYEMQALTFHEAVPGHHLQISLAKEIEGLPEFRQEAYFVAFGEGWALYSERLGKEVGFFETPYDEFGRLLYEMWRATRLVVDTGMHAFGWSRDRAIQYMLDNTALSELNIRNEIDRYITWPGQATAYKLGELKITELRARAEEALGESFDVRAFHDVVLGAGTVPLPVLERRVIRWIGTQAASD